MTSLPTSFVVGSASSAIASYRRAQYFATESIITFDSDLEDTDDEAECHRYNQPDGIAEENQEVEQGSVDDTAEAGVFQWDEANNSQGYTSTAWPEGLTPTVVSAGHFQNRQHLSPITPNTGERTPLLKNSVSISSFLRRSTPAELDPIHLAPGPLTRRISQQSSVQKRVIHQHRSTGSIRSLPYNYGGKSTFGQTLFNSIAILLGIGVFSEPLAFAYSGWIGGTVLIVFYGLITCYTAKILAHIILDDPRLRSYADIGRKAFGQKAVAATTTLLFMELFTVCVVLVTLYADSLHSIAPTYSANTYKLFALAILIPTVFLPLSLLSYTSILGILSVVLVIVIVLVDGLSKTNNPGSLWDPAETCLGVKSFRKLGVAYGLFMAGFSGHAVIPSLARDMIDPREFDRMINWAFVIATVMYGTIGAVGYLMFGEAVSDEVSQDLLKTPGFNPTLNHFALWLLVISPLSKFALSTRPLNVTLEVMLGLDNHQTLSTPDDTTAKPVLPYLATHAESNRALKRMGMIVERSLFTVLSVAVSILIPGFSNMMAFLGAFSAFVLCVIGPVSAKVAMAGGRCGILDASLLAIAIAMAVWGTSAAFLA